MMGHKKRNTEKEGGALALDPAEGSDRLLDSELARGGQNGFRVSDGKQHRRRAAHGGGERRSSGIPSGGARNLQGEPVSTTLTYGSC